MNLRPLSGVTGGEASQLCAVWVVVSCIGEIILLSVVLSVASLCARPCSSFRLSQGSPVLLNFMSMFLSQDEDARVKKAFQTMLTYIGNVAQNPDEEKYRKIRLTNAAFQVCSISLFLRVQAASALE